MSGFRHLYVKTIIYTIVDVHVMGFLGSADMIVEVGVDSVGDGFLRGGLYVVGHLRCVVQCKDVLIDQ